MVTMLRCCVRRNTAISDCRLSSSLGLRRSVDISFTAAFTPVPTCRAFHTMAKEPEPMGTGSSSQLPTRRAIWLLAVTQARAL